MQYLVVPEGTTPRPIRYSGETYLQLANIGEDIPKLLRFTHKYGPLYGPGRLSRFEPHFADVDRDTDDLLVDAFQALAKDKRYLWQYACSLYELRRDAAIVTDMTSAWRIWSGKQSAAETAWSLEPGGKPIKKRADAAAFLEKALAQGLGAFHPRVRLIDHENPDSAEILPDEAPQFHYLVGAYAACCAELFNHITENARYRRCQNPTCGRFFVRQQGRARHGQHRMEGEVKYCSRSCATSVAKRRWREKKKREERGL